MHRPFAPPAKFEGTEPRFAGPGKLVTRAVIDLADGHGHWVLGARQFRKGIPPHHAQPGCDHVIPDSRIRRLRPPGMRHLNDWIAVLFMIGSACFLIAGVQAAFPDAGFPMLRVVQAQNLVFFIGSIFFTSAAGLQLLQSIRHDVRRAHQDQENRAWWDWRPNDPGYMASLTQFAGTLLFNLNTGNPLWLRGNWLDEDLLVWTPDFIGSVLFLVSSIYGCLEVGQRLFAFQPRNVSWWIAQANLLGSILFQVSAFLSIALPYALPQIWSITASLCTAGGAAGFFVAAALMIPEQADHPGKT